MYKQRPNSSPPAPLRRSDFAQELLEAKAQGHYIPDVELVWFRPDIAAGCLLKDAKLFAFEQH